MALTVERVAFPPRWPMVSCCTRWRVASGRVVRRARSYPRNGCSAATRTRAAPVRAAFGEPVGDNPPAAAGDDVEEAGRATAGRREVDQAGDELRGPGRETRFSRRPR